LVFTKKTLWPAQESFREKREAEKSSKDDPNQHQERILEEIRGLVRLFKTVISYVALCAIYE